MNEVTLVVTACGRPDLLDRTLRSFVEFNTYPIVATVVIEDGANGPRVGQIASIDKAYACVETPYIFHCEDDWEFYRPSFIEPSMAILEAYPTIYQVWLREHGDTNGHPLVKLPQYPFEIADPEWVYRGFSFNPGLRRLSDYRKLGSYGAHTKSVPGKDWVGEGVIGNLVYAAGFHAAILSQGYVRHTGEGRRIV